MDVTNKSSFPVHVTSGLKAGITPTDPTDQTVPAYADIWKDEEATTSTTPATSRFVSHADAFKRVYWGIDPNYSMGLTELDKCKEQFTIADAAGTSVAWKKVLVLIIHCIAWRTPSTSKYDARSDYPCSS